MSIIKLSKQIADPRVAGRTVHKMEHIIYITIAAVIAKLIKTNDITKRNREKYSSRQKKQENADCHKQNIL